MSENEPIERAQDAIDEARSAASSALPGHDLPAPPSKPSSDDTAAEDAEGGETAAEGADSEDTADQDVHSEDDIAAEDADGRDDESN